jgi:hypothetical protein
MDRCEKKVRVSFFSGREPTAAQVADIEGELTAGWDPAVVEANVGSTGAIFRRRGVASFAFYLIEDDFLDGWHQGETLFIRTGGLTVAVAPPAGF